MCVSQSAPSSPHTLLTACGVRADSLHATVLCLTSVFDICCCVSFLCCCLQVGKGGLSRVLPIHRQIWELGRSTHICGILNATPDSFSDGGRFVQAAQHQQAAAAGRRQQQQQQGLQQQQPQPQPQPQQQEWDPPSHAAGQQAQSSRPLDASSSSNQYTPGSSQPAAAAASSASEAATSQQEPTAAAAASTASQPATVVGHVGVDVAAAVEAARAMARAGAAVIDVGGQSTRPGSQRISVEEELSRVLPIIRLVGWFCGMCRAVFFCV